MHKFYTILITLSLLTPAYASSLGNFDWLGTDILIKYILPQIEDVRSLRAFACVAKRGSISVEKVVKNLEDKIGKGYLCHEVIPLSPYELELANAYQLPVVYWDRLPHWSEKRVDKDAEGWKLDQALIYCMTQWKIIEQEELGQRSRCYPHIHRLSENLKQSLNRMLHQSEEKCLQIDYAGYEKTPRGVLSLIVELDELRTFRAENFPGIILPRQFSSLRDLTTLYLHKCGIEVLPDVILQLTALEHLYLSDNKLHELPQGMGELKCLNGLGLANNQLTVLPDSMGQLKLLKVLDIKGNLFTEFPPCIIHMKSLHMIGLNNMPICEITKGWAKHSGKIHMVFSFSEDYYMRHPFSAILTLEQDFFLHREPREYLPSLFATCVEHRVLTLPGWWGFFSGHARQLMKFVRWSPWIFKHFASDIYQGFLNMRLQ